MRGETRRAARGPTGRDRAPGGTRSAGRRRRRGKAGRRRRRGSRFNRFKRGFTGAAKRPGSFPEAQGPPTTPRRRARPLETSGGQAQRTLLASGLRTGLCLRWDTPAVRCESPQAPTIIASFSCAFTLSPSLFLFFIRVELNSEYLSRMLTLI